MFNHPPRNMLYKKEHMYTRLGNLRNGPLEMLWGGRGIFEPQEFFFVIKFHVWIFLGRSMNIFRVNWRAWIFFHLIFPWANIFFCTSPAPSISLISNGQSLRRWKTQIKHNKLKAREDTFIVLFVLVEQQHARKSFSLNSFFHYGYNF